MRIVFKWVVNQPVLLVILLCFVSRLPQLYSHHLLLDGDECIVGLMAKHFSEGLNVPCFFYGQSYGFTFVEVVMIRIFYLFFGVTDIAVKLSMLSLWTLGIVFFYKTLGKIGPTDNKWFALFITAAFILSPSFAVWSMKARGGYLTSFLFCWIITYMIFSKKSTFYSYISAFIIGFLIVVIYQSQALWLAGLMPIIIYWIYKNKDIRSAGLIITGMSISMIVFYFLKMNLSTFWAPPTLNMEGWEMKTIFSIPNIIFESMTGSYDNSNYIAADFITKCIAAIVTISIFVNLIIGLVFFIKRENIDPLYYILCFSVACSFGYLILLKDQEHRYLLPLSGFVFMHLYLLVTHLDNARFIQTALGIFIVLSAVSMYNFKNYIDGNRNALLTLNNKLISMHTDHIYCEGGLVQWQIMFYSKEKIIARCKGNMDRYPEYIQRVDESFQKRNAQTALVGFLYDEPAKIDFVPVDSVFFIVKNPDKELLIEREFNLNRYP